MTAFDMGREKGREFWAEWVGPNGDGSLGSGSIDFVESGPAYDAAWDSPESIRSDADARAEFARGFVAALWLM